MLVNETTQQFNEVATSFQERAPQSKETTRQKNIFVSHKGCYHNLKADDILWISSEGNYAHIYTKEKHFFNRISLTNLLKILPAYMFRKVHKCFIVRLDAIDHIDRSNNELFVAGNKIPIGRSYKANLLNQLNLIG